MPIKFFCLGEEMAVVGRLENNTLHLTDTIIEADHPEHVRDVQAFIDKYDEQKFRDIKHLNKTLAKSFIVAEPDSP